MLAVLQETSSTASPPPASPEQVLGVLADIGHSNIYLMGMSFILGSLFTILILILLDFMRRNAPPSDQ